MAFCTSCGTETALNERFCHSCGKATGNQIQTDSNIQVSQFPPPAAHHPQSVVHNVHYSDTGAIIEFVRISAQEASNVIAGFFTQLGFRIENGSPMQGTYGKGSAVARVAVGGFVTREKYSVVVQPYGNVIRVQITSSMSGFSGGFIGLSRERNARHNVKHALGMFLNQLPPR